MARKPRYIDANKLINKKQYQFEVRGGAFPKSDFFIPVSYVFLAQTADVVSTGVADQYKWERDTAIAQLEELGIGFGQKKPDMVEVVRCKDCKHWIVDYYWNSDPDQVRACRYAGWICGANGYCLYGERKMDAEVEGNA